MNIPETYDYLVRAKVGLVGQAGRRAWRSFIPAVAATYKRTFILL